MPNGGPPQTKVHGSPEFTALIALHTVVAFLVTVVVNLVQVKFQGKPESPFETHPLATSLAVFSLLLYCSLALVGHLSLAPDCCARAFGMLMMVAAALLVASFTALLVRRPFHSFPYLLSLVLLSMALFYFFVHGFRADQPAALPLLPLTRQHVNAEAPQNRESVQVDTAPDVLGVGGALHQHTPGNDFQICNCSSSHSGSSTAVSDRVRPLRPEVHSLELASVTTPGARAAEGDREVRLDMAGDGGESVDGGEGARPTVDKRGKDALQEKILDGQRGLRPFMKHHLEACVRWPSSAQT